jgi:hypothetical protein
MFKQFHESSVLSKGELCSVLPVDDRTGQIMGHGCEAGQIAQVFVGKERLQVKRGMFERDGPPLLPGCRSQDDEPWLIHGGGCWADVDPAKTPVSSGREVGALFVLEKVGKEHFAGQ